LIKIYKMLIIPVVYMISVIFNQYITGNKTPNIDKPFKIKNTIQDIFFISAISIKNDKMKQIMLIASISFSINLLNQLVK